MDWSTALNAILLGLVEGITEFLPVSSTGHLILAAHLLGFEGAESKVFEVVIQLGAILAVCWLYRVRLWHMALHWHDDARDRRFIYVLIIALLPSAILGFFLHDYIKLILFNPLVVCIALIVGGMAILAVERWHMAPGDSTMEDMPLKRALLIGCCQALALIPGVSRSGATIIGALLAGAGRKTATEFSFFLAIPTMVAASAFELVKAYPLLNSDSLTIIALGFVVAFFSALLVVKTLVGFVGRHGFAPFAWYRIVLGIAALLLISV